MERVRGGVRSESSFYDNISSSSSASVLTLLLLLPAGEEEGGGATLQLVKLAVIWTLARQRDADPSQLDGCTAAEEGRRHQICAPSRKSVDS